MTESKSERKRMVEVDGRHLQLSNLDKVLYPQTGFTKGDVIDYYARVGPVLLPHLRGRPASFKRYPDGVTSDGFFAKNAPSHTPDWVRTVELSSPGSTKGRETVDYVLIEDMPTLIWTANLAALELHVPQWKVGSRGSVHPADLVVFDLDPGAPATIVECCRVACLLRDELAKDRLEARAKSSGSKGMQLYIPIVETPAQRTSAYAKDLAQRLERQVPNLVVHRMAKNLRPGKVLVDWSQNNAAKTTVAPYSLRARTLPTVSTPLTWDEVENCRSPEELGFLPADVLARTEDLGDLMAALLTQRQPMPRET